jgi:hypothetical protein
VEGYLPTCYTRCVQNQRFDDTYFDRYYGKRPVRTTNEVVHLAAAVHDLVAWWGGKVRSVLEVGAGPGDWSNWYRATHPEVRVLSTDVSEHACSRYGHERRDIAEWTPRRPFDLVVCMDVLQYLDDRRAVRALNNLAAATRTCLYFDALTVFDARHTVDRSATDLDAHLRGGDWYRDRLSRHFVQAGAGLWVRRTSDIVLHELERTR